jgi:ribonuclease-3
MAIGKNFESLEKKIGYKFSDSSYLENALTHSSYSNEYKLKGLSIQSNERLEFLGDAVLEIAISEYLFENFKKYGEGKLTRIRQQLVCEKTLAKIAAKLEIGEYIHLGKGEENDCRKRPKVLADTLEAIIGAIYLDCKNSSNENYLEIITELFINELNDSSYFVSADCKTLLQQFIEKDGSASLIYEVAEESGPEHNKTFTVICKVNNNIVGKGIALNKKDAEMQAAMRALELFGLRG